MLSQYLVLAGKLNLKAMWRSLQIDLPSLYFFQNRQRSSKRTLIPRFGWPETQLGFSPLFLSWSWLQLETQSRLSRPHHLLPPATQTSEREWNARCRSRFRGGVRLFSTLHWCWSGIPTLRSEIVGDPVKHGQVPLLCIYNEMQDLWDLWDLWNGKHLRHFSTCFKTLQKLQTNFGGRTRSWRRWTKRCDRSFDLGQPESHIYGCI